MPGKNKRLNNKKPLNLRKLLAQFTKKIQKISTTPQLDAEIITLYALKKSREWLYANFDKSLNAIATKKKIKTLKLLIQKRTQGEPVAYLTHTKEFYGLDFLVTRNVLIPRPESEQLVDLALKELEAPKKSDRKLNPKNPTNKPTLIVDIGTGSGCIITAIYKNSFKKTPKPIYLASDISSQALKVTAKNLKKHQLSQQVKLEKADLAKFLFKKKLNKFKQILVIANLPYLTQKQYQTGSSEIKKEPKKAFLGGKDGLVLIKKLINQLINLSTTFNIPVKAIMEIDETQKKALTAFMLTKTSKSKIRSDQNQLIFKFFKDLAQRNRILKICQTYKSIK